MSKKKTMNLKSSGLGLPECIKEVSLWNYEKSASEVDIDFENYLGYSGSETGLKGYWKVNEGTSTNLNDVSSGNHDLTTVNTPSWTTEDLISHYSPDVILWQDYYAFGMIMPGRSGDDAVDYRHTFNGMEKDDEVKGNGNSYDFGARIYDPRVGRWLSSDPYEAVYPSNSTYSFALNNPIYFIDPNGGIVEPWVEGKHYKEYTVVLAKLDGYSIFSAVYSSLDAQTHNGTKVNVKVYSGENNKAMSEESKILMRSRVKPIQSGALGHSVLVGGKVSQDQNGVVLSYVALNFHIALRPNGMTLSTVYEEFFHTGQTVYYLQCDKEPAPGILMETEAKIAKIYEYYSFNNEGLTPGELRSKMVTDGFSDYELNLLFLKDEKTGEYIYNEPVKEGFDYWDGNSDTMEDPTTAMIAAFKTWSKTLNSNEGDPYYEQLKGQVWDGNLDYLDKLRKETKK